MRETFARACLAVALLLSVVLSLPLVAIAQGATPTAEAIPTPPGPPESGPGSDDILTYPGARGTHYGAEPGGFWLWEPTADDSGATPSPAGPFPVILYNSGCCGNGYYPTPEEVDAWMTYMVRQGYVVLEPVYNSTKALDDFATLFADALAELQQPGHAAVDLEQFVVIGYSFGGPISVNYAASAAANGWPIPRAIFLNAPCEAAGSGGFCVALPENPTFPPGMKAIVLAFEYDYVVSDMPKTVYASLMSLPAADRNYVEMMADDHGSPPLNPSHPTAFQNEPHAHRWGIWKLSSALFACALRGEWCEYALGNTPEQRSMGTWSDGVPVAELEVTDDPDA